MRTRSEIRTAAALRDRLLDYAAEPIDHEMLPLLSDWAAHHPEYDGVTADITGTSWSRRESLVIRALCDHSTFHRTWHEPNQLDHFRDEHGSGLSSTQRRLLAAWERGTVSGYFDVVSHDGASLVARHLGDGLDYRIDDDGTGRLVGKAHEGDVIRTRVLPVGGRWIGCGPYIIAPGEVRDLALFRSMLLMQSDPEPSMRNPAKRARAREVVAAHHTRFLELFGSDVVEGDARTVIGSLRRFVDALLATDEPVDWCLGEVDNDLADLGAAPAFAVADEYDEYDEYDEDGEDDLPPDLALVHHPVKGARLVEGLATLRSLHVPRRPVRPFEASALRAALDDPLVPSFVFATLAEAHPHRTDALYAEALDRPEFCWERDGRAELERREPWTAQDRPGLVVLPDDAPDLLDRLRQRSGGRG